MNTVLSQLHTHPFHITCFSKSNISAMPLSTSRLSKWSLTKMFHNQNYICICLSSSATCPVSHSEQNFTTLTISGGLYKSRSSTLCSILNYLETSRVLDYNKFLSILNLSMCNLYSFLKVRYHVSERYKETGKITAVCVCVRARKIIQRFQNKCLNMSQNFCIGSPHLSFNR
jgi:hypothetical protein